jgi:uncharacterized membrane protein
MYDSMVKASCNESLKSFRKSCLVMSFSFDPAYGSSARINVAGAFRGNLLILLLTSSAVQYDIVFAGFVDIALLKNFLHNILES